MQVKLIMSINQAERLSIWIEIFPKTIVLAMKMCTAFPINALTAGIEVDMAIRSTKIKFALALIECGNNGIRMIPPIENIKARASNKESVIGIRNSAKNKNRG
jgi:hypothetical protein